MKAPLRIAVVSAAALLAIVLIGCSEEASAARKVDVKAQIAALKSDNADTRINACVELAKAGPRAESAVQPLIAASKDPNRDVRRLAAYALGQIGPAAKAALPTLKGMIDGTDREIDEQAANAINFIDPASPQQRVPNVQTP